MKKKIDTLPKLNSICEICQWYTGNKKCFAFSRGIPDSVWKGIHDKPVKGQLNKDILYSPKGNIL